jgi:excisionase family DNA binding protein
MALTLSQAARSCGRGKTTLLRAVRSGRLSATRDETGGTWLIEPSELARVFPPGPVPETTNGAVRNGADRPAVIEARIAEMIETQRLRDDFIADLRARLDRSETERREAQARVAALLADQRPRADSPPTPEPPRTRCRRVLRALGHTR